MGLGGRLPRPSRRGQSSIVGIVLIMGMTIAVAGAIVMVGGSVLTDAQSSVKANQAEQAMTQLDSRASTVSLGDSSRQTVQLSEQGDGRVSVQESAGHIRIRTIDETGPNRTIVNEQLGAVVYEAGGANIAYQAGGVWRKEGDSSTMVSPPEYRYHDNTLTFPIVQVTGDDWRGSATNPIQIESGDFEQVFPSATAANPIEDGHIHVNVTSEYHHGWKAFFESRTEGVVTHQPADNHVSVNLTAPFTENFDTAVAATSSDNNAISHDGSPHGGFSDTEVGAVRPSASPLVDAEIEACKSDGCQALPESNFENGTYYESGDVTIDGATYDTSDGAISVVVDGDLTLDGDSHVITGGGEVTFYITGDLTISGGSNVNTDGDASDLTIFAHSDSDHVTLSGNPQLTGFLYAPSVHLEINGGGDPNTDNIAGAAVVETAHANGNGNVAYEYPEGTDIEFEPIDTITFLHITRNEIAISPR